MFNTPNSRPSRRRAVRGGALGSNVDLSLTSGQVQSEAAAAGPAWNFNTKNTINGTASLFRFQNKATDRFIQTGNGQATVSCVGDTTAIQNAMQVELNLPSGNWNFNSKTAFLASINMAAGGGPTANASVYGFNFDLSLMTGTYDSLIGVNAATDFSNAVNATSHYAINAYAGPSGTSTNVAAVRAEIDNNTSAIAPTVTNIHGFWYDTSTAWSGGTVTNEYGFRMDATNSPATNVHGWAVAHDCNLVNSKYVYWGAATSTALASRSGGIRMNGTTSFDIEVGTTVQATWTSSAMTLRNKITSYNNIATAGWGVPAIQAAGRVTAQTAANASISTYTVGAADGSFQISANMNVTASTTLVTTLTCTYTDESNTARTMILPITQLSGSFIALGAITGTGAWETPVMHIRCKAATAITIKTTAGTFTGVTYTAEGIIKQVA